MKPTSIISILGRITVALVLLFAIQPAADTSAQPLLVQPASTVQLPSSAPSSLSATAPGCQWSYYPIQGGKLQAEQALYNDPDNTPIVNLSLGNMYKGKSTQLASTGSTDFNGDNKTDVFRTFPRSDGNLQWQTSSGGTAAWQNLAYASSLLPTSQLKFGEFNGDKQTDVFTSLYNSTLTAYQWLLSSGGTASFTALGSTAVAPARLAVGDFNGDGQADVFTATQNGSTYQWAYAPGGSGSAVNLAFAGTDPSLLNFGDFNGDGKTDVFAANQLADGSTQWLLSSGGAASYTNLNASIVPYSELKFGDFDGDGKTDVLAALPQDDGSLQVVIWPSGLGAGLPLGRIPAPAPALRVGDFNGDGISDLMALRCGMNGPLAFGPLQTLAQSGYSTFNSSLTGDINGDGMADVILVSTCQNPNPNGTCATHRLQVSAALGNASHTFTLVPAQQLGADSLDFTYYKILTGDFDGDGKSDLALIYLNGGTLTIYVATSNGDGSFTLASPQVFAGETWSNFNPTVGDYNGDGKADLALTTVCGISSGSCSNGDNNSLYVATSTGGGFTMSSRQDLSPAGWTSYIVLAGDFNGDGKSDLLFNSTCMKTVFTDPTCTVGDANLVYTALSNGLGGFVLSPKQTYGASGWTDYSVFLDRIGDVNGDGRSDLVWFSPYQAGAKTYKNLVAVGFANSDGSFQLGSLQDFGSAWTGSLSLADLNQDGKADLVWNNAPLSNSDVDTYVVATSNGNGTFNSLGQGSVYTSLGYFQIPNSYFFGKVATSLILVSNRQDSISNALFIVSSPGTNGVVTKPGGTVYLPFIRN